MGLNVTLQQQYTLLYPHPGEVLTVSMKFSCNFLDGFNLPKGRNTEKLEPV